MMFTIFYFLKGILFILFFSISAILISCEKDKPLVNNDTQSVIDNIYAEKSTELIFNVVNDYSSALMREKITAIDSGVVITITPLFPLDLYPKTMIINYGNGVLCSDGHQRKGKIITVYSNKWCFDSTSAKAEITLNGFYCDNVHYIANIVIENKGFAEDCPEFILHTNNSKLVFENGESTLWSTEITTKWISGYQTLTDKNDDVFISTGNTTGISREAKGYSSTIAEPLKYDNTCNKGMLTKGVFEIVPQGLSKRVVDFGNGNCDNIASVTINGMSFDLTF